MVEAGHFKELESILHEISKLDEQSDDNLDAPDPERQTFLFSATLMLPSNAREFNARFIKKGKSSQDITMDTLLQKIKLKKKTKIVDLSQEHFMSSNIEQVKRRAILLATRQLHIQFDDCARTQMYFLMCRP